MVSKMDKAQLREMISDVFQSTSPRKPYKGSSAVRKEIEKDMGFSPEELEKMRANKPPSKDEKELRDSDYYTENKMNIKNIIREELKAVLNEDDDDYDDFPSANDLQDLENTRRWESDRLNADDQHGSLEQIAGYADDVNNLAKHVLAGEGSLSDALYDIQTKTLLIKQLVKQHQREMEG